MSTTSSTEDESVAVYRKPLVNVYTVMLVISLPSMVIAALKLRQRTLGPILEGNGWAVNGRVRVNIPFGAALTRVASLPADSRRSLEDPYEDRDAIRRKRMAVALLALALLAAAAIWVRLDHNRRGRYFWETAESAAK